MIPIDSFTSMLLTVTLSIYYLLMYGFFSRVISKSKESFNIELDMDTKDFAIVAIPNFITIMLLLFFHASLLVYAAMFLVCLSLTFVYALAMSAIHRIEETEKLRALFG